MEVKQHKFGNHLFPDEQVCIILSGAVEINCHSENPSVSKLIGRFEAGDIIGFKDGDSGITNNV
jgi:CRP-like cAMP-binding protein